MTSIRDIVQDHYGAVSTVYDLLMRRLVDVVKERPELSYNAALPLAENRLSNEVSWMYLDADEEAEVDSQPSVGSV